MALDWSGTLFKSHPRLGLLRHLGTVIGCVVLQEGEEKARKQNETMAQRRREKAVGELQGGKDDSAAGRKRRHEEAERASAGEAGEHRWVAG